MRCSFLSLVTILDLTYVYLRLIQPFQFAYDSSLNAISFYVFLFYLFLYIQNEFLLDRISSDLAFKIYPDNLFLVFRPFAFNVIFCVSLNLPSRFLFITSIFLVCLFLFLSFPYFWVNSVFFRIPFHFYSWFISYSSFVTTHHGCCRVYNICL